MKEISKRDTAGIAWWNGCTPATRAGWLRVAGSARPVDAFQAWESHGCPDRCDCCGGAMFDCGCCDCGECGFSPRCCEHPARVSADRT